MLQEISWTDYWMIIAFGTFLYYIIIILVYFREDVKQLLQGQQRMGVLVTASDDMADITEGQFAAANRLTSELQEILQRRFVKEEMIMAMQQQLKKYAMLKGTAFEISINNFIVTETAKRSIDFSEEDLRVLW